MYNLSYSGILYVESHADILVYCARAGVKVEDLNRCIRFESTATDCSGIFANMKSFNKSVVFPNSVRKVEYAFTGCSSFSQYIFIDHTLYNSVDRSPQIMGLAESYPADRIIVTNNNKSFDLYLGKDMNYPPSVPGIIQLLRNYQQDEFLNCKMFFRSLPELHFTFKNVYIYIDNIFFFFEICRLLDAAGTVNPEMFADTVYHLKVEGNVPLDIEKCKVTYGFLSKAIVNKAG